MTCVRAQGGHLLSAHWALIARRARTCVANPLLPHLLQACASVRQPTDAGLVASETSCTTYAKRGAATRTANGETRAGLALQSVASAVAVAERLGLAHATGARGCRGSEAGSHAHRQRQSAGRTAGCRRRRRGCRRRRHAHRARQMNELLVDAWCGQQSRAKCGQEDPDLAVVYDGAIGDAIVGRARNVGAEQVAVRQVIATVESDAQCFDLGERQHPVAEEVALLHLRIVT